MSKKREIFRILERDCVNPITEDRVKQYIDELIKQNQGLMYGKRNRRSSK